MACLRDVPNGGCRVDFEADNLSQNFFFGLQGVVFDVGYMVKRQVHAALSVKRTKTDKTDAHRTRSRG